MEATNVEKFKIINKQWAKADDICKLTGFGKNKAYEIIKNINLQILREGKQPIATATAPMTRIVEYLGISKQDVYTAAQQEKELFGIEEQAS